LYSRDDGAQIFRIEKICRKQDYLLTAIAVIAAGFALRTKPGQKAPLLKMAVVKHPIIVLSTLCDAAVCVLHLTYENSTRYIHYHG